MPRLLVCKHALGLPDLGSARDQGILGRSEAALRGFPETLPKKRRHPETYEIGYIHVHSYNKSQEFEFPCRDGACVPGIVPRWMGLTAEPLSDKERKFLKNKNAGASEHRRGSVLPTPSNPRHFRREGVSNSSDGNVEFLIV